MGVGSRTIIWVTNSSRVTNSTLISWSVLVESNVFEDEGADEGSPEV
jgi:hypothetical protein